MLYNEGDIYLDLMSHFFRYVMVFSIAPYHASSGSAIVFDFCWCTISAKDSANGQCWNT